jgi:hypothetical protein
MFLSNLLDDVKKDLARHAKAYAASRARLPLLAAYATTDDLLSALRRGAKGEDKGEIVALLVREAQAGEHPLWSALLVAAFTPFLVRLRRRSQRPDEADEDQDQVVLLAFLDAVREVPPGEHVAMALRWKTEGKVFGRTRDDRLAPETDRFDDHVHGPSAYEFERRESARADAIEVIELLEKHGVGEALDVLLCTEALDEPLTEYVARTTSSPRKRAREVAHLTRVRNEAAAKACRHFERRGRAA